MPIIVTIVTKMTMAVDEKESILGKIEKWCELIVN
jgi:hypothetical protein